MFDYQVSSRQRFRTQTQLILNLVCQGAGGLGGQDWDGPHRLVGRLLLGHTAR
jgi:hypothetical protein